jgi:hypothetical protein
MDVIKFTLILIVIVLLIAFSLTGINNRIMRLVKDRQLRKARNDYFNLLEKLKLFPDSTNLEQQTIEVGRT